MNETQCRRIVRERSGGMCEICPRRAVQMHHRRNRSQGGQWIPSNILHLCVEDHDWIGKNIAAAWRSGWTIQGTLAASSMTLVRRRDESVLLWDDGSVIPASQVEIAQ